MTISLNSSQFPSFPLSVSTEDIFRDLPKIYDELPQIHNTPSLRLNPNWLDEIFSLNSFDGSPSSSVPEEKLSEETPSFLLTLETFTEIESDEGANEENSSLLTDEVLSSGSIEKTSSEEQKKTDSKKRFKDWNDEEKELLIKTCKVFKNSWKEIADHLNQLNEENLTPAAYRYRYNKLHNIHTRKKARSKEPSELA